MFDEGYCIWLFQQLDQLLSLPQMLPMTFFSNVLNLTSSSYPFLFCRMEVRFSSFSSFQGKRLSEQGSVPILCVYSSQNNGVLILEMSSELTD